MATLNQYLNALNTLDSQNQFVTIDEVIQKGADPLRKHNEAIGAYREKRTYMVSSLGEVDDDFVPTPAQELDVIRALLAEGWVIKDLQFRLEKPGATD